MNYKGVFRTALATPDLLKTVSYDYNNVSAIFKKYQNHMKRKKYNKYVYILQI